MKKQLTRMGMMVLVIVLAFGVVGTAAAQGPGDQGGQGPDEPVNPPPQGVAQHDRVLRVIIRAFGDATGLTWLDVLPAMRDGAMLGEVIADNWMDPVAVAEQVKAEITAEVQAAVADGDITQEQADRAIATLDDVLDRLMNNPLRLQGQPQQPVRDHVLELIENTLVGTIAEMAGVEAGEVVMAWREAGSLSAAIEGYGLDVDAVLDETVARVTVTLEGAVANGRLDEARAAQILEGLRERLADRVDNPFPVPDNVRRRVAEGFDMALLRALADMTGVEPRDITREALTPPSMADIAAELGLDVEAILAAAEASITDAVNEMVANGVLTEAEAAQLLDGLHDRLVDRFNAPLHVPPQQQRPNQRQPQGQGGRGPMGPGQGPNNPADQPPVGGDV